MRVKAFFRANKTASILTTLYFIPAMLWVLFSDKLLFKTVTLTEAEQFVQGHEWKDFFAVLISSLLIFSMVTIAARKLSATRRNYKALFYHHPDPMWIYDIETLKFLDVNDAAVKHYGFSRKEFLSMYSRDIRPPEEVMKVYQYVSDMQPGVSYRHAWKHRKKNGEIIMVEATSNEVLFEKKACYLISITDITERNIRDEQIKKLSLVAQSSTTSMVILDRAGIIEWVNEPFTILTGYTLEEVVGKQPQDMLHGPETDEETRQETFECITQGKSFEGEIMNYRKNGTSFWLRLTISPVIENNEVVNFVTVQTDITLIKLQNKNLRDIAFAASHQFRKPLANILGLINEIEYTTPALPQLDNLKSSANELDQELIKIIDKTTHIRNHTPLTSKLTHMTLPFVPEI